MKSTGIVRKIDELGRIVIPKELRDTHGIGDRDAVEVFTDEGGKIVLKKYEPGCVFTGQQDDLIYFEGKFVSKEAIRKMALVAGMSVR